MSEAPPTPPGPPPEPASVQTVLGILQKTTELFKKHGVEAPRLEAELLLAKVLGVARIQLYVDFNKPLKEAEVALFRELVKRRGRQEPVHYILGEREFWALDFFVERNVLIPRADTECLIEEALPIARALRDRPERQGRPLNLADIGTGSGIIAVVLAKELPEATVVAGDLAPEALALARKNAERHGVAGRVTVVEADGLAGLAAHGPFDLIVSNPPYIRDADFAALPPHIRLWEPRLALTSGADGLDAIRGILAALSPATLAPGGALLLEIGDGEQANELKRILAPRFEEVRIRHDYGDDPRVVVAAGFKA